MSVIALSNNMTVFNQSGIRLLQFSTISVQICICAEWSLVLTSILCISLLNITQPWHKLLTRNWFTILQQVTLGNHPQFICQDIGIRCDASNTAYHVATQRIKKYNHWSVIVQEFFTRSHTGQNLLTESKENLRLYTTYTTDSILSFRSAVCVKVLHMYSIYTSWLKYINFKV